MRFGQLNPVVFLIASPLLALTCLFGSYLLAFFAGDVPLCFPPLQGCTTISATGFKFPAAPFYLGLALPDAVLWIFVGIFFLQWFETIFKSSAVSYWLKLSGLMIIASALIDIPAQALVIFSDYELSELHSILSVGALLLIIFSEFMISLCLFRSFGSKFAIPLALSTLSVAIAITFTIYSVVSQLAPGEMSVVFNIAEWNSVILVSVWPLCFVDPWREAFKNAIA